MAVKWRKNILIVLIRKCISKKILRHKVRWIIKLKRVLKIIIILQKFYKRNEYTFGFWLEACPKKLIDCAVADVWLKLKFGAGAVCWFRTSPLKPGLLAVWLTENMLLEEKFVLFAKVS